MSSIKNNVRLIGFLGKDPEIKNLEGGRKLVTCSIATHDFYKNEKGERVEDTQWHALAIWGKLAERAGQNLKKGSEVVVEGKLVHKVYETSGGEKRYVTEVNVKDLFFLGPKQN